MTESEVLISFSTAQKKLAEYFCDKQALLTSDQELEILNILQSLTDLKSRIRSLGGKSMFWK